MHSWAGRSCYVRDTDVMSTVRFNQIWIALLLASALQGISEGQVVLYPGGIVGKVQGAGLGAQVRLLSDPGFSVTGGFTRFQNVAGQMQPAKVQMPQQLFRGAGKGTMKIF